MTHVAGRGRSSTSAVARAPTDINTLVYRYGGRFPHKQSIAVEVLRKGIASGHARISHQSFV